MKRTFQSSVIHRKCTHGLRPYANGRLVIRAAPRAAPGSPSRGRWRALPAPSP